MPCPCDGEPVLFGLGPGEELLGWINVGSTEDEGAPAFRPAPDLSALVTVVGAGGLEAYPARGACDRYEPES